jgi:signal transduction histidine kinase
VQEALTNVARHAAARRVRVAVRRERAAGHDALVVEVADDGRGIRPIPAAAGFGLAGMRERVESLGGTLALGAGADGAAAPGTVLRATLPLERQGEPIAA